MLAGCANPNATKPETPKLCWRARDVVRLILNLIDSDPTKVETMIFYRNGDVSMTFGYSDGRTVSLCGPIYQWRITAGRLLIFKPIKNTIYDELTLISRDSKIITVRRRNGKLAKYKYKIL